MKKSTILKILIIIGVIDIIAQAIVYLPPFILYIIGVYQLGGWIGIFANKLYSHIK